MKTIAIAALSVSVAFAMAACSGSHSAAPLLPAAPESSAARAISAPGNGIARFVISGQLPSPPPPSVRSMYFSPNTQSVSITLNAQITVLNLTPQWPTCTLKGTQLTCLVDVPTPNGPITYSVSTYAQPGATGKVLSQASGNATISGTTKVPLVLKGIVSYIKLTLAAPNPQMGAAGATSLTVSAYDPTFALIIGSEPYSAPITLTNSDLSGATKLSRTAVTSPQDKVAFWYDGRSFVNATITAKSPTAGSFGSGMVTMLPALEAAEFKLPSGATDASNDNVGTLSSASLGPIWFLENTGVGRATLAGAITEYQLNRYVWAVSVDPHGNAWILNRVCTIGAPNCNYNDEISRVRPNGALAETSWGNRCSAGSYCSAPMDYRGRFREPPFSISSRMVKSNPLVCRFPPTHTSRMRKFRQTEHSGCLSGMSLFG